MRYIIPSLFNLIPEFLFFPILYCSKVIHMLDKILLSWYTNFILIIKKELSQVFRINLEVFTFRSILRTLQ